MAHDTETHYEVMEVNYNDLSEVLKNMDKLGWTFMTMASISPQRCIIVLAKKHVLHNDN